MIRFKHKIDQARVLFEELYHGEFECFACERQDFRTRVELSFFHKDQELSYAMFDSKTKKKYPVESLDFADEKIRAFMPLILEELRKNWNLKHRLFGVEFLATKLDFSATLLYHKDIDLIKEELGKLSEKLNFNLIARSRSKKLVFGKENLRQILSIEGEDFFYELSNDCFIQPNTFINEKMCEWILKLLKNQEKRSLLELYCGYGNLTLPLSKCFKKVLATELSKINIGFALKNCELNLCSNISFVRICSEDLSRAFSKEREFFRLKNIDLESFDFSHILVDPPRAGLDEGVIKLIKNYENIIYISCNPLSLKENLKVLNPTHKITHFALFDQFKNTPHLECGVFLKKKINKKRLTCLLT